MEIALGGIVAHKGNADLVSTVYDPFAIRTQGTRRFSTINGSTLAGYQIVPDSTSDPAYFAKGNGLGAPVMTCDAPPTEIGNRVWLDSNNNGIQDPNESGIANVVVKLFNSDGSSLLAQSTTDANGVYAFSNDSSKSSTSSLIYGITGLSNGQQYQLKVEYDQTALSGLTITSKDSDSSTGGDLRDSDGTKNSADASAPVTVSSRAGENDHTVDFGFFTAYALGNRVWIDTNENGILDNGESGLDGVSCSLLDASSNKLQDTTTSGGGYYLFTNLAAGNYQVSCVIPTGYTPTSLPVSSPNNDVDSDNNGVSTVSGSVFSASVTLGGTEPTGETDLGSASNPQGGIDNQSNMTVDFGFVEIPATPTPTAIATATATATATPTPTATATAAPTNTPIPTPQPALPTATATSTPEPIGCRVIDYTELFDSLKTAPREFVVSVQIYSNRAARCDNNFEGRAKRLIRKSRKQYRIYRRTVAVFKDLQLCEAQCVQVSYETDLRKLRRIAKRLYRASQRAQYASIDLCSRNQDSGEGDGQQSSSTKSNRPESRERLTALVESINNCPTTVCQ